MMKQCSFVLGMLGIALVGCSQSSGERTSTNQSCDAERYETLLWKPQSALDAVALPNDTRVIPFGSAVTQDFRPNRLNITIGKLGRIERIFCG